MKKILYVLLLIAELFIGALLLISLLESSLYIPVAVTAAAMIALLIWQIRSLVKATDPALKKKIRLRIALIMLLPFALFIATYVYVVIALIFSFAN